MLKPKYIVIGVALLYMIGWAGLMSYCAVVGYFHQEIEIVLPAWVVATAFVSIPVKFALCTYMICYMRWKNKSFLGGKNNGVCREET